MGQAALILQQHDGFARGVERQRLVGGRVHHRIGNSRVQHALRRIEQAEPESRHEHPFRRARDLGLCDGAGFHFVKKAAILAAESQIGQVLEDANRRTVRRGLELTDWLSA